MKKTLLTISTILTVSTSLNAQIDTLTDFFTGTPTWYTMGAPGTGYYSGNNSYGDLGTMQLFDAGTGVTAGGSITNLLVAVAEKDDNGGTFQVAIWADVAGVPGTTPLGFKTVTLASVDTTDAGWMQVGTEPNVWYNVNVTFTTPIAIPAGNKFWAGILYPTTPSDSVAIWTNEDGDYADSPTHTKILYSDLTYGTYGGAIALNLFPVVNLTQSNSLNENTQNIVSVYPNPANDVLNFDFNSSTKSIEIISVDGKTLATKAVNETNTSMNIGHLEAGIYTYKVTSTNGAFVTNKFVKN